jgi:hypothetical protein
VDVEEHIVALAAEVRRLNDLYYGAALNALQEGAADQAAGLAERLPAAGLFASL